MEEKELNIKQNGMAVLLGILALYVLLTLGIFASARFELNWLITVIVILMCLIWIPLCGRAVLFRRHRRHRSVPVLYLRQD